MSSENIKKIFLGFLLLLLLISIPLTLTFISQKQDPRGRASGTTVLSFTPASTASAPIQKSTGDTVALDIMINPGTNLVTFVRYQVTYDPTKLEPVSNNPVVINQTAFPVTVEGPVLASGTIAQSISIGSDPTKVIKTPTKVGTITFRAIGPTGSTPTVISYGTLTQALSAGQNEQAGENVLASTTPAYVAISGNAITGTPTTATPTSGPTPPPGEGTLLNFRILLHGVGAAGDNPNPSGNSLSNKNPLHPQRNLEVQIFDINNQMVSSVSAPTAINYQGPENGGFVGSVNLGANFASGKYNIKIKTDRYLRRLVPGIITIEKLQAVEVPEVALVAGDVNSDNNLNVIDYNALRDCGFGKINPLPIADPNAVYHSQDCQAHQPAELNDVNDDGIINSTDYNLFVRELSVQNGD